MTLQRRIGALNQVPVISGTNHPYTTMGPDGGVVGVGRLPGFAQADARVLYNYVDLPTGVSATVNNDAGVTGTHRGHVWSDWAPRDNYRATVRVGAPSGTTQGVQVDLVEFRSYATGAIPYFPTLRFPGQYADAETEKYINWNRFYDPQTGRYWQPEPMFQSQLFVYDRARAGISSSPYAYAESNPIRYVDPTGLDVCNYSSNTIYVKPEIGTTPIPVEPGNCFRGVQDGFSVPARFPDAIYKTRDHVDACVEETGSPRLTWPGSGPFRPLGPGGSMLDLIGFDQLIRGGWKNSEWVSHHKDWEPLLNAGRP